MSWRVVVVSSRAKLEMRLNYLVIRKEDTIKIHMSEIAVLIIESTAVSLTASLLCELVKRKVKVILCNEKRNPISELTSYYGSHDSSAKIKHQIRWSKNVKDAVWTEIVTGKIRKQKALLECYDVEGTELLDKYIREIKIADSSNREGHAAKVYFNKLFGMDFSRGQEHPINAALNYGYSILLSAFNREVAANGYLTQLGIFHDNIFNHYNLSSDLMEPYRPIIDEMVFGMSPDQFEKQEKLQIINILNTEGVINGQKHFLLQAIKIYCKSVFEALNEGDTGLIKFYNHEL